MAVATKSSAVSVAAATSNAAGATTTGTEVDCSTYISQGVMIRMTNGGTGPTIPCRADVQIRESGSGNWRSFIRFSATTINSDLTDQYVELPPEAIRARVVFDSNTGQAVTVEAVVYYLSAIA